MLGKGGRRGWVRSARTACGVALLGFLSACGGGGGSGSAVTPPPPPPPPPPPTQAIGGLWAGPVTTASGATVSGLGLVTEDGRFFLESKNLSTQCAEVEIGQLTVSGATVSGTANVGVTNLSVGTAANPACVLPDGSTAGTATITGTVSARASLALAFSAKSAKGTVLTMKTGTLTYQSLYAKTPDLRSIAGTWVGPSGTTFNLNAGGELSILDPASGCQLLGVVTIVDPSFNAYQTSLHYQDCTGAAAPLNGQAAPGLFTLDDALSPPVLISGFTAQLPGAGAGAAVGVSESTIRPDGEAQAASLAANLAVGTGTASVTWKDTITGASTYLVQAQAADGSWASVGSIAPQGGTGAVLAWSGTVTASTTFRVVALTPASAVFLETTAATTSVSVPFPTLLPQIVLGSPQPLSGSVNVSIAGNTEYLSATYFVDLNQVATSSAAPAFSTTLNTATLSPGSHLLLVRLSNGSATTIDLRLTIQVGQPELSVAVRTFGTSGTVTIWVIPTSTVAVTQVTASIDGRSLGTQTQPVVCTVPGCQPNTYVFTVDAVASGSGTHTITGQATDANGVSASSSATVTFANPPKFTLTAPFDGALVNGSLPISGTFGTDKPGVTVSLTLKLGDLPVLSTASSPFTTTFSLAGLPPGSYMLEAQVVDSTLGIAPQASAVTTAFYEIIVTSTPALAYAPLATLGASARLLAAGGAYVVYGTADGHVHQRSPAGDSLLPTASLQSSSGWRVADNGYVTCTSATTAGAGTYHVYGIAPGGALTDLSAAVGSAGGSDALVAARYPWVLWSSGVSTYTLYNVQDGSSYVIPGSAQGAGGTVGNINVDFATVNGVPQVYYWTESGTAAAVNVYAWNAASGSSVAVTSDNRSLYPQADGTYLAWQTAPAGASAGSAGLYTLNAEAIGSGAPTALSTQMTQFSLAGGLLGWVDGSVTSQFPSPVITAQAVRAWDGSQVRTVASAAGVQLIGSNGGLLGYQQGGESLLWSPAAGSRVVLEAPPSQPPLLSDSTLYFTTGAQNVLYGVPLH